jgi:hypothetical protein
VATYRENATRQRENLKRCEEKGIRPSPCFVIEKSTYTPDMSVGSNTSFSEHSSPQFLAFDYLRPSGERIREEMSSLQKQLKQVEDQISAVKNTLYGLSVIFGEEIFSQQLLQTIRPKHGGRVRGLTATCQAVLTKASYPCSVSAVCNLVSAVNPLLLIHHRNPRASVMTVLRNFAKRGQAVRGTENGRSAWRWAHPQLVG